MENDREAGAREQRQLALMVQRLQQFEDGSISLHSLINDLEALLGELQQTPDEWIDAFRGEWSVLEIAYAVADDRREPVPTMADSDIASAVRSLSQMVAERVRP